MTEQVLPAGRQDNPPVHERTKIDDSFRYGCNNHPKRVPGYWAPNRTYRHAQVGIEAAYQETKVFIETEWIAYDTCPAAHEHQGCIDCVHKEAK